MSLEQALHENTAAAKALTAALSVFSQAAAQMTAAAESFAKASTPVELIAGTLESTTPGNAEPATKPASTRATSKSKADAASSRTAEAGAADAQSKKPETSVTRYFFSEKHDSVWSRTPEDPEVNMAGAVEITADEYRAHQTRLAAKYAKQQSAQKPADTTPPAEPEDDPFAEQAAEPAQTFTFEQVVAKLQAVAKHPADQGGGNGKVKEIINAVGANKVPEIAGKPEKFAEVVAACNKVLGA